MNPDLAGSLANCESTMAQLRRCPTVISPEINFAWNEIRLAWLYSMLPDSPKNGSLQPRVRLEKPGTDYPPVPGKISLREFQRTKSSR